MPPQPVYWGQLSTRQIAERARSGPSLVILPLGSTEQHANHLPVDVDMLACYEVARGVSAHTGALLLPPLAYGESTNHKGFPGTLSLTPATFIAVVTEICEGVYASGFRRLVLLNGHFYNLPMLMGVVSNLQRAHDDVLVKALSYWDISPRVRKAAYDPAGQRIGHAGDSETSIYLAVRPDLVNMAEARDESIDGATAGANAFFNYLMAAKSPTGGTGNPLVASAEKGRQLLEMAIADLSEQILAALEEEPPIRELE